MTRKTKTTLDVVNAVDTYLNAIARSDPGGSDGNLLTNYADDKDRKCPMCGCDVDEKGKCNKKGCHCPMCGMMKD